MKKLKVLLIILGVLVVLAGGLVLGVVLFANGAVRRAVESAGSKTLNVSVEVEEASVSVLGGSLALHEVQVANPPEYDGPVLLVLRQTQVEADAGSLLGNEVRIHSMELDDMEVFVEQKGLKNNLYEVIEPLRAEREPTGKRLIIDSLVIRNVTVHVDLPAIPGQGQAERITFALAPIEMTDLGRDERLDTPVLISKVLLAVAAGIAEQGGDVLPKETIGDLSNVLDKAIDLGRVIFGPGKDEGGKREGAAGELGRSVSEGLKNILGPNASEEQE